jgi:hypothetical protein
MASRFMCSIVECDKPRFSKGYCQSHYNRFHRTGSPLEKPDTRPKFCSVEDCHRKVRAKGCCTLHYGRLARNGDPLALHSRFYADAVCKADGCNSGAKKKGYCETHYQRVKRTGGTKVVRSRDFVIADTIVDDICSVPECDRAAHVRGVCHAHYHRFLRHGGAFDKRPIKVSQPGTRFVTKSGYLYFCDRSHPEATKNGNVLEHRAVMAAKLGRKLLPGENVHHINGVRADNRPENLEIWVTLQPSGQRPDDILAWASEVIARYGYQTK